MLTCQDNNVYVGVIYLCGTISCLHVTKWTPNTLSSSSPVARPEGNTRLKPRTKKQVVKDKELAPGSYSWKGLRSFIFITKSIVISFWRVLGFDAEVP